MQIAKILLILLVAFAWDAGKTAMADNYKVTIQQNGYFKVDTGGCNDTQTCVLGVHFIGSDDGKSDAATVKADFNQAGGTLRFFLGDQPVSTSHGASLQLSPRETQNGMVEVTLLRPQVIDDPSVVKGFNKQVTGKPFAKLTINITKAATN